MVSSVFVLKLNIADAYRSILKLESQRRPSSEQANLKIQIGYMNLVEEWVLVVHKPCCQKGVNRYELYKRF